MGEKTIREIIDGWKLSPRDAQFQLQRLKMGLSDNDRGGFELDEPPKEAFFMLSERDLEKFGIMKLLTQKEIIIELQKG